MTTMSEAPETSSEEKQARQAEQDFVRLADVAP
jgi:hypothetical protein